MTTKADQFLFLQIAGLKGRALAFSGCCTQVVSPHHATVEPVDLSSSLDSANHADVRAVYLRHNVRDQVFRESKRVWHFNFDLMPSHFQSPASSTTQELQSTPACGAQAREFLRLNTAPQSYGVSNWNEFQP